MVQARREKLHEQTREEIKAVARKHMAESGAVALSLRAIAAELGMTAPALYRYYANRDALITALILDGFNALADTMEAAGNSLPEGDYVGQLRAVMLSYRAWAMAHPTDYQLIYGNPIPAYHAPAEITVPAAVRVMIALGTVIERAMQADALKPTTPIVLPTTVHSYIQEMIAREGFPTTPLAIYLTTRAFCMGHGLVTLEMFEHLGPTIGDPDAMYRYEVEHLLRQMGLVT